MAACPPVSDSTPPTRSRDSLYRRARRFVARGTRTERDLRAYLERQPAAAGKAAEVFERLRQSGWVDDRACARLLAEDDARRGYAWGAARQRLQARGLAAATVEAAVRPLERQATDRERAAELARAEAERLQRIGRPVARMRASLLRYLARRGFDEAVVDDAAARALGASARANDSSD